MLTGSSVISESLLNYYYIENKIGNRFPKRCLLYPQNAAISFSASYLMWSITQKAYLIVEIDNQFNMDEQLISTYGILILGCQTSVTGILLSI